MKPFAKKKIVNFAVLILLSFNTFQGIAQNKFYKLGEQLVKIAKSGNADKLVDFIDEGIDIDQKAKIMESFLTLKDQMFTMVNKDQIELFNVLKEGINIYIILTDKKNFAIIKTSTNDNNKISDVFTYLNTKTAKELATGNKIYKTRCYSCHGKFAKGGVGPNLSDNYWKYVSSSQDLYDIIANGKKGTMMIAYKSYLKPDEIKSVLIYIKALQNKKQNNPKKPEGDNKDLNMQVFN